MCYSTLTHFYISPLALLWQNKIFYIMCIAWTSSISFSGRKFDYLIPQGSSTLYNNTSGGLRFVFFIYLFSSNFKNNQSYNYGLINRESGKKMYIKNMRWKIWNKVDISPKSYVYLFFCREEFLPAIRDKL